MIYALIYVQECELGREGMPSKFDGIVAVKAYMELGEGVGTKSHRRNILQKIQPNARFLKSRKKEFLFKEIHEQDGVGRDHSSVLDIEVMLGVKGEMVVGGDNLGEMDKELSGW